MSNDKPKVSIIMTAYNSEKTIEACIDSIISQTYNDWEFIINDDASTDKTSIILSEYKKKDPRIKVIRNVQNGGIANGLNRCLKIASGKYIAIMDADDISLPKRIGLEVNYLENHPSIDVVGSSMIVFNENGIKGIRVLPRKLTKDTFLAGSPFANPTVMMRKSALDALGGYSVSANRAMDIELWFRLYSAGFNGMNLSQPLHKYRENISDYKRRNFSAGLDISKVFFKGYQDISIPWYKRWRALKPVVSPLIPNHLLDSYRQHKMHHYERKEIK